jgi:hypothetical protein
MSTALQIHERPAIQPARQTLEPNTLAEAREFAKVVANSDLAPKDYRGKPDNIIVAIQYGKELSVPPMQALQGIAVINGRPSTYGDLQVALVTNHPEFEDLIREVYTGEECRITLKRRGRTPITESFTMKEAHDAGFTKNPLYKTSPKRMLFFRAFGYAARTLFPDALKGMVSYEEASDYSEYDGRTIEASASSQASPTTTAARKADAGHDPVISQDQARDFGKAWKASGYTVEEAKTWLKEKLNLESSLKIPAGRFDEAMQWAKTPKDGATHKAPEAGTAAPASPAASGEPSPEEKNCREAFGLLDWTLTEQAAAIDEHKGDWQALLVTLNRKLSERDGQ